VVRGAFGVPTPARPATSLSSFLPTAFAPKVFGFVFPDLLYVILGPEANTEFAQSPCSWSRNLLLTHPAMKSVPTDPNQLRDFSGRVSLHFYIRMTHTICQAQNRTRQGMISMPRKVTRKSISIACQIEGTKTPKCWLLVGRTSALRTVVRPAAIASLP
jgi:hypothetical protein